MRIPKLARERADGLVFLTLGCLAFLLIGFSLESAVPVSTTDFRVVYFGARCLLEHGDPYSKVQLADVYRRDGGETPYDTPILRAIERQYIYLPSALPLVAVFALFSYGPAHTLWLAFTAIGLIISSCLIWEVSAGFAPRVSGLLIGLLVAD